MSDIKKILENDFLILPPLDQRGEDKENHLYKVANGAVLGPSGYDLTKYDMSWRPIVSDDIEQEIVVIGGVTILVNKDDKIPEEIKAQDINLRDVAKQAEEKKCNYVWGMSKTDLERKSGENEGEQFYGTSFSCKGNVRDSQRLALGQFLAYDGESRVGVYFDSKSMGAQVSAKAEGSLAGISTLKKNKGDPVAYFKILNANAEAKLALEATLPWYTLSGGTAVTPVVGVPFEIRPSVAAGAEASIAKIGVEGEMKVTTVTLLRWVFLLSSSMAAADGVYVQEPEIDGIPVTQLPDNYKQTKDSWSKVLKYNVYMNFGAVQLKGKYSKNRKYIKRGLANKDVTTVGGALGVLFGFGFEVEVYDE